MNIVIPGIMYHKIAHKCTFIFEVQMVVLRFLRPFLVGTLRLYKVALTAFSCEQMMFIQRRINGLTQWAHDS